MVLLIVAGACTAMPLRPSLGRRITLTDEQLAAYDRDGVVLVKGVLTGRKLQRAQAAAHRVIPSNIPSKASAHRSPKAQATATTPQPHSRTAPQPHSPTAPQQPHSTTTAGITLASSFRDGAAMACYARWRATPPCQTL